MRDAPAAPPPLSLDAGDALTRASRRAVVPRRDVALVHPALEHAAVDGRERRAPLLLFRHHAVVARVTLLRREHIQRIDHAAPSPSR